MVGDCCSHVTVCSVTSEVWTLDTRLYCRAQVATCAVTPISAAVAGSYCCHDVITSNKTLAIAADESVLK